ncbi:MAG: DUF47 family protein [Saccharofermentans sp.]|nr:DUF47 family protein [Saccharofermentans sp.]
MAKKTNDIYWNNYLAAATSACSAADYLCECLKTYDLTKIEEMLLKMHVFEHDGDSKRHEMAELLAKAFVTPIERDDMADLSQKLDHVIDSIEEVLQAIYINAVTSITPEAISMAEKISLCTVKMKELIAELPNFKKSDKIHPLVVEVNTAEEECDTLFLKANYEYTKNREGKSPFDVIAWREIYTALEECADACEHVADTIEAVVMKNT